MAGNYSNMSDTELEETVESFLKEFPNTGYKRMKGFLSSKNIRVQEERVRSIMRRVDPEEVVLHSLETRPIIRREYSVKGPLSLWAYGWLPQANKVS